MADKIVVLQAGRVEQVGSPMELYHNPVNEFVAGFIGAPAMNFLDVSMREGWLCCADMRIAPSADESAKRLGIRPEHILVVEAGEGDLDVAVKLRETLGGDAYLYVDTPDGQEMVVRTDGDTQLRGGTTIGLSFPAARIHAFDSNAMAIGTAEKDDQKAEVPA